MGQGPRRPDDPSAPRELEAEPGVEPIGDMMPDLGSELAAALHEAPPDFDDIVAQHGRRLFHLAYRLTANRAEAEDLSQETLVRGYLAIRQFRGESSFYTYLYRILLNLWKNQIRSRSRWKMVPLPAGGSRDDETRAARELPDPAAGPHERLIGLERSEALRRALAGLEPEFRAVLALRVAEGLEYEEIAQALGLPIGTVRSRLARARSRIRELMLGR